VLGRFAVDPPRQSQTQNIAATVRAVKFTSGKKLLDRGAVSPYDEHGRPPGCLWRTPSFALAETGGGSSRVLDTLTLPLRHRQRNHHCSLNA